MKKTQSETEEPVTIVGNAQMAIFPHFRNYPEPTGLVNVPTYTIQMPGEEGPKHRRRLRKALVSKKFTIYQTEPTASAEDVLVDIKTGNVIEGAAWEFVLTDAQIYNLDFETISPAEFAKAMSTSPIAFAFIKNGKGDTIPLYYQTATDGVSVVYDKDTEDVRYTRFTTLPE